MSAHPWGPSVLGGLGALAATLVGSTASADLKLKWDCYLPGSRVDCVALESSLTSKIPFLKTVSTTAASPSVCRRRGA